MEIISRIRGKVENHAAALALMAGAAAFFIANASLSKIMNSVDYGAYSLIATLLTISTSFGLLGHEQSILRLSSIKNKILEIPKKELHTSVLLCFVSPIVGILYLYNSTTAPIIGILDIAIVYTLYTLGLGATLLCYIDRGRDLKFHSQLHAASWKVSFLAGAITCLLLPSPTLTSLLLPSTIFQIIFVAITFKTYPISAPRATISKDNKTYNSSLNFSFLLTMLTGAALSFGDRLFIQTNFGLETLGRFFLYQNLLLSPLLIISSYLAINQTQHIKNGKCKNDVITTIKKQAYTSVVIYISFLPIVLFVPLFDDEHKLSCLIMLAIGASRIPYSTISAIQSIGSSPRSHHIANIISLCPLLLFLLIYKFDYLTNNATTPTLYLSILAGWLLRSAYILKTYVGATDVHTS